MAAPRKDNVKGKILDAAEALLQTKNLSDISLAEIAALAGVSKGTLYYHYKTRRTYFSTSPTAIFPSSGTSL
jgi:AcrR family transcriptional regulator